MSSIDRQYRVLFLLGVMRSGTTYFRNILASNRNIRSLGSELNRFWTDVGGAPSGLVPECKIMSARDATSALCNKVKANFDAEFKTKNSPYNLVYRCYRKFKFGNETILKYGHPFYLLNKSTHLLNKILFVDSMFPDTRYVFIVRNIYSQVFSLYRHLLREDIRGRYLVSYPGNGACWSFTRIGSRDESVNWRFSDLPTYWFEMNDTALRQLDRLTGRVTYVSYESLVRNPQEVLANVASMLGAAHLNTNINNKLINNYSDSPLESWKQGLSDAQKEIIASTIRERESHYEYICSHVVSNND